jgi:hypothetical protein
MSEPLQNKKGMCYLFLYFYFYEINKTGLIYSESKNLPKKRKSINQNKKITLVYTLVIWNLIIA